MAASALPLLSGPAAHHHWPLLSPVNSAAAPLRKQRTWAVCPAARHGGAGALRHKSLPSGSATWLREGPGCRQPGSSAICTRSPLAAPLCRSSTRRGPEPRHAAPGGLKQATLVRGPTAKAPVDARSRSRTPRAVGQGQAQGQRRDAPTACVWRRRNAMRRNWCGQRGCGRVWVITRVIKALSVSCPCNLHWGLVNALPLSVGR